MDAFAVNMTAFPQLAMLDHTKNKKKIFLIKNFIVYFNITLFSLVNFKLYKGSLVSVPAGVLGAALCVAMAGQLASGFTVTKKQC